MNWNNEKLLASNCDLDNHNEYFEIRNNFIYNSTNVFELSFTQISGLKCSETLRYIEKTCTDFLQGKKISAVLNPYQPIIIPISFSCQ